MTHPTIERWLNTAPGRRMNPDGRYGLQCVDATDLYAQEIFGVPWQECVGGVGGARELLDRVPDAYWIRIDNNGDPTLIPQRGDVLVFDGNGPDGTNPFGHTAVALGANIHGVSVVQQDGFAPPLIFVDGNWYSNKPAHVAWLGYWNAGTGPITGWLRPRPEKLKGAVSVQSSPTTSTPKELFTVSQYNEVMKELANIKAVLMSPNGYRTGGKSYPSIAARLDAMPDRIWRKTTVRRGGKDVPVLQDLADGTTYALQTLHDLKLSPAELAKIRAEMDASVAAVKGQVNVRVSVDDAPEAG